MKKRRRVLVLPGWFHRPMISGIARRARESGWHLDLIDIMTAVAPWEVAWDGMLLFHTRRADLVKLAQQQASRCPTVLISGMAPIVDAPIVKEDCVAVGRMAARHFLDRGFQRFAWLSNENNQVSRDRCDGFVAATREAGYRCLCIQVGRRSGKNRRATRQRIVQRLRTLRFPLALYALDDLVAVNAIEICQDHGIRVPEDVAVLGTGNVEMAAEFWPSPCRA